MENNISPRIRLVHFKTSDVDELWSYMNDERMSKFASTKAFTSKDEVVSLVEKYSNHHFYFRSICLDDDDRSVGFVSIQPRSGDDKCRANVGFALIPEYWNQGITTRAVKMAIAEGWKLFPEVVRLEAMADVDNKSCHRVMEKLGFHKEGVLRKYMVINDKIRDMVVHSLLFTDHMP